MTPDPQTVPSAWPIRDADRGRRNLTALAGHLGPEAFLDLMGPLTRWLPRSPDPDLALNNLERVFAQPAGRTQLPALIEGRGRPLDTLLRLLGTSQFFADVLASDPEAFDLVRGSGTAARPLLPADLQTQLQKAVDAASDDAAVLRTFRRFRRRQVLRIGVADVIRDRPLEEVTLAVSRTAEVAVEVAVAHALRRLTARYGEPVAEGGKPARFAVIGFGKLGGEELNYSSDIDLMFVYDEEGDTRGKRVTSIGNDEFFARVVGEVVRLLSAHTDRGQAYRVDLRLRPEGQRGPLARLAGQHALLLRHAGPHLGTAGPHQVRPVAGDLKLGEEFLRPIEPFVYRKYLSFAEINEIKALKRRIEHEAAQAGAATTRR